jgi:hypothetical protein
MNRHKSRARKARNRLTHGARPRVEQLEDRLLLSDLTSPSSMMMPPPPVNQGENPGPHNQNQGKKQPGQRGGDPVYLSTGEFYYTQVDLSIPGRGLDWQFERTYRSQIRLNSSLGRNWQLNYSEVLKFVNSSNLASVKGFFPNAKVGDVYRIDDTGHYDLYAVNPDGSFTAPLGYYTTLVHNADGTYTERYASGLAIVYGAPKGQGVSLMRSENDRDGNTLQFQYTAGRLSRVIDTLGRPIDYIYDSNGMLSQVRDFFGRTIQLQHDPVSGDLLSVTSPAVTGTPDGNDFPNGKTWRYTYSSGFTGPLAFELNDNLLTITRPNEVAAGGPAYLTVTYNTDTSSPNVDKVIGEVYGGTNASGVTAGGSFQFSYQVINPVPSDPNDTATPVYQTTVTDRDGNIVEYQYNQYLSTVQEKQYTNRNVRPSDPDFYLTQFQDLGDSLGDSFRRCTLLTALRRIGPARRRCDVAVGSLCFTEAEAGPGKGCSGTTTARERPQRPWSRRQTAGPAHCRFGRTSRARWVARRHNTAWHLTGNFRRGDQRQGLSERPRPRWCLTPEAGGL